MNVFFLKMEFSLSQRLYTNFSFSRWNLGYNKAFFMNFFFLIMELCKTHNLGETPFIYITKSIYIGSALSGTAISVP
jgi:hypothetical protein